MNINKKILFTNYRSFKITEDTRQEVLNKSSKHTNCPLKIRMGMFYTDEEWEKRSKDILSRELPDGVQKKKLIRKIK